jgi:hypothetical protein
LQGLLGQAAGVEHRGATWGVVGAFIGGGVNTLDERNVVVFEVFSGQFGGAVATDAPRGTGGGELPRFKVGGATQFADVAVGNLDDEAEVLGGDVVEGEVGGYSSIRHFSLPINE